MQQKKRHHYVPKAYLNAFCNEAGRLLVYRKDAPGKPLHVAPDATQFRRFYYSQPQLDGGTDNNRLEDMFSDIEGDWPDTVLRLHRRENMDEKLNNIFEFIALQRARVPASRDAVEAMLAATVKTSMKTMLETGKLPLPPKGFEDLPEKLVISIDPHRSIQAMVAIIEGMGLLFSSIGLAAVHNATPLPFLTSDNPVVWFDPSLPFAQQRPYTVRLDGPIVMQFPVSPTLMLLGASEYKKHFSTHGLTHCNVPDEGWVEQVNAQTCRFGYEAVIAQSPGQETIINEYVAVSPVHQAITMSVGDATLHRYVFGPRIPKPKWRDE